MHKIKRHHDSFNSTFCESRGSMIKKHDHKLMGRSTQMGWLDSHFHFSFAKYFNLDNVNFGVLRVINDDMVAPGHGFGMHPHQDMEIISYVINGHLTHGDNMGNRETITRGHIQYMSAGTGIVHSEVNEGEDVLRFLQIWIMPNQAGYAPNYGDYKYHWHDRLNKWLPLINGEAPAKLHQDVKIYATFLEAGNTLDFPVKEGRQAYLVQIEGTSTVNNETLVDRDALSSVEESLVLKAVKDSHYLILEMAKA